MPYSKTSFLPTAYDAGDVKSSPKDQLAALIRSKLAAGTLPHDQCHGGIIVSLGSQQACHACAQLIPVDEVEMRARYGGRESLRLHARCFAVWHEETQHITG